MSLFVNLLNEKFLSLIKFGYTLWFRAPCVHSTCSRELKEIVEKILSSLIKPSTCTIASSFTLKHSRKVLQRTMEMDMVLHIFVGGFKEMGFLKVAAAIAFIELLRSCIDGSKLFGPSKVMNSKPSFFIHWNSDSSNIESGHQISPWGEVATNIGWTRPQCIHVWRPNKLGWKLNN